MALSSWRTGAPEEADPSDSVAEPVADGSPPSSAGAPKEGASGSQERAGEATSERARGEDGDHPIQFVDPAVSRAKFGREVENYRAMEAEYLRRGWILLRARFPEVVVLFAAPQITPSPVILGVIIDFTNYDFWPPSVRFVHPFTLASLPFSQMPTAFWKRNAAPLLQSHEDQVPFLCARGIREYHHHPAHSNDPWLAHRLTGVGTLYHLLDIIHRHGIAPFTGFVLQIRSMDYAIGLGAPDPTKIPE